MPASTYEEIIEAFDDLEACVERLCALSFDRLDTAQGLAGMDRIEKVVRTLRVPGHALIHHLRSHATVEELGGTLGQALADRMRITKADADLRIRQAADLGPRHGLGGEPLAPLLPATAAAQRQGLLGDDHIAVIRTFFTKLHSATPAADRADAEHELADKARGFRPDELAKFASALKDCLKPDGDFVERADDTERTVSRGITLGKQQPNGMSAIRGTLTPACRAALDAVLAKLAAPGMCNPDDPTPTLTGKASAQAIDCDPRGRAQRNHDALQFGLLEFLSSTELGQHHGLPTSIVVTTTLAELEAGAGRALTAAGTLLPMTEVIALAGAAHHYLAVFDQDKTLALYHGKRLANPEQRLTLFGRHRGCTRPGCTVPGYWTQAHHLQGWLAQRRTHIDELTLACAPDNRIVELHKYITRNNTHGQTEWIPPPHLDHGRPTTNPMHHPERSLHTNNQDNEPD